MAKMLPAQYDASTASAAERRLFELLRHDPDSKEWIVLHSLGLSRRGGKPYGEIDFVVVIPAMGVFCLEVKGGRISCQNGEWTTTNRLGQTDKLNRSPFLQAREGMFALRDAVLNRAPVGFPHGIVFGYGVVMPDISFPIRSPEWEPWQALDRDVLRKPISAALRRLATGQAKLHPKAPAAEPTTATVRILQQLLRPDFEVVVTRGTQIEQTEEELLRLTEEQFVTLDTLADNERCLVEGAAGTGKTMLALEFACRAATAGRRTLLICFNRLLGDWLERQTAESGLGHNLTAGRYFKLLRDIIVNSSLQSDFLDQERCGQAAALYETTYADFGRLAVEECNQPYDLVVMDEAQDLLRPGVLGVLNGWIRGGTAAGSWAVFGDFQRQAIFCAMTGDQLKGLLKNEAPHFAKVPLKLNCRNTRNIGEETALLSGFDSPPYRMGQIDGLPVDYRYYRSSDDQKAALTETVKRLLGDGVKAADIMIISRLKLANSGVAGVSGGDSFRVLEIDESPAQSRIPVIRFSTAQAFKGMESSVVILCDVEKIGGGAPQSLLYVAMSRARSQLTVLVHEQAKPAISERVRRKLLEASNKKP
jgi:hypothetical protein